MVEKLDNLGLPLMKGKEKLSIRNNGQVRAMLFYSRCRA